MKLWVRHVFVSLGTTFLFLLFAIFAIYLIVDFSIHGMKFLSNKTTTTLEISIYYFNNFANHLDYFLPLTFLLSSLKVLFDLRAQNALTALHMAGISSRKILSPFFAFAIFLTLATYANHEWIVPNSQTQSDTFKDKHKRKKEKKIHIHSVALEDHSELIYQSFQKQTGELFDVFWIKNSNDFWHAKYLKITAEAPIGKGADHFVRNSEGKVEKVASFSEYTFPSCSFDPNLDLQKFIPFENRSLSTLFKQSLQGSSETKQALCYLHHKLAAPLLSILILCLIAPICMQFGRSPRQLITVGFSIILFISSMIVLDGMLILGENEVVSGSIAIWSPILLLALFAFKQIRQKT